MRGRTTITVFALALCPAAVGAAAPQPEAVMTIAGIPGPMIVRVDRTDWAQIQGLPDPRMPELSGISGPLSSRAGSPLTSRGGTSDGRSGKVEMQDFVVVKDLDKASPKLGSAYTSGEHIAEVKLEIIPAGGDQRGRLVITLKNVVIAQVVQQPATGRDRATEAVTFTCESLEWESQPAAATWRASPLPHSVTPRPP